MSTSAFQAERTTPASTAAADAGTSAAGPGSSRPAAPAATVAKELVHRSSAAEVMLAGWARTGDTRFTVTARWPHGHSFFTPVAGGYHDPLIGCETIRQTGILLGHAEFGVPLGHQFVVWDIDIAVHPEHLEAADEPALLDIDVRCTQITRRGSSLSGMRLETVFRRDGHTAATGGGSFSCMSPAVYRRVRGAHLPGSGQQQPLTGPAAPQSVGRTSPKDVVLSPADGTNRWLLRADTRHPVLFEHASDHVPGMVLAEAARQAAAAALGRSSYLPLRIASEFMRYVEIGTPCTVEAALLPGTGPSGEQHVSVTAHQNGQPAYRATVTAGPHHL
ncbi:ScbA/BarX family gamma-butyrolactone biosynthesis protein [Streptomyces sp. NPDC058195]|uniref:ScbA/BarX family gamma-butyrolactone biosynthesis protein n=1 Tax=Streptomyces sp. NPDC058195 TaxID=3346375 RepID=UPI0036EC6075